MTTSHTVNARSIAPLMTQPMGTDVQISNAKQSKPTHVRHEATSRINNFEGRNEVVKAR